MASRWRAWGRAGRRRAVWSALDPPGSRPRRSRPPTTPTGRTETGRWARGAGAQARRRGGEGGPSAAPEYADRGRRERAMGEWIERHDVQLVVLAGFMQVLTPGFIRRFE